MILYPNMLLNSVIEITPNIFKDNNINAIIIDTTIVNKAAPIANRSF